MKTIKVNDFEQIPKNFSGIAQFGDITNNTKYYYKDGLLHRIDGPAVIVSYHNEYFVNGIRHRIDGPAITFSDGYKEYFINGKQVTREAQEVLYFFMRLKGL